MKRSRQRELRNRKAGFAILIVLFLLAVLTIVLMQAAPKVATQLRREQEQETMQRAHQYVVAIRRFYRKFGRYPNSLQELESTNNLRFLRREYKDPITGDDFRLLHPGEAMLTPTGFFGQTLNGQNGSAPGTPVSQQGTSDNSTGGQSSGGSSSLFQPLIPNQPNQSPNQAGGAAPGSQVADTTNNQNGTSGLFGDSLGSGGPIIGVAGTSKQKSLMLVNGKDHYNDWQFVYDPRMETVQGGQVGGVPTGNIVQPGVTAPVNGVQPQQPQGMPMTPAPPQ